MCEMCHVYVSLMNLPDQLIQQSFKNVFESSYVADALRCNWWLIFVLRECVTLYTKTHLIPDVRLFWQWSWTYILLMDPPAIICVESAPGFITLLNDDILHEFQLTLEIGCVKNVNKNPAMNWRMSCYARIPVEPRCPNCNCFHISPKLPHSLHWLICSQCGLWTQWSQFTYEQVHIKWRK